MLAADLQALYEERLIQTAQKKAGGTYLTYGQKGGNNSDEEYEEELMDRRVAQSLELSNIFRSVPRKFTGIVFELCFNQEDFDCLNLKLYTLTQRRKQWDSPEFWKREGFTLDHRLDYARDLCDFWYLTCNRKHRADLAKACERTLHFYFPWLSRATNRPHGELLYRIVLCAHECLRRSQEICCQPYDELTALDFKSEMRRVKRTIALLTYLKTVVLPTWEDYDWASETGMCCTELKLESLLAWLNAWIFFMSGTVLMCMSRGQKFPEPAGSRGNTTGDPVSASTLLSSLMRKARLSRADTCSRENSIPLAEMADLAYEAAQTMAGTDVKFNAMVAASASVQRGLILESEEKGPKRDACKYMAMAAAAFRSAANLIIDKPAHREVFWTEQERLALSCTNQVFLKISHEASVNLPSCLHPPISKKERMAWTLTVGDSVCLDWAYLPWWDRLTGLYLRCLGDYYLGLACRQECPDRARKRVYAGLCHVVALTTYGTNVLTPENISRTTMDPSDMNRRTNFSHVANPRKPKAATVNFTFLSALDESYMAPFKGAAHRADERSESEDSDEDEDDDGDGMIHISWQDINEPLIKASDDVCRSLQTAVSKFLPHPERVERR